MPPLTHEYVQLVSIQLLKVPFKGVKVVFHIKLSYI